MSKLLGRISGRVGVFDAADVRVTSDRLKRVRRTFGVALVAGPLLFGGSYLAASALAPAAEPTAPETIPAVLNIPVMTGADGFDADSAVIARDLAIDLDQPGPVDA
jgi:hypothetical protein